MDRPPLTMLKWVHRHDRAALNSPAGDRRTVSLLHCSVLSLLYDAASCSRVVQSLFIDLLTPVSTSYEDVCEVQ